MQPPSGTPSDNWQVVRSKKRGPPALQTSAAAAELQRVATVRDLDADNAGAAGISKLVRRLRDNSWYKSTIQRLQSVLDGRSVSTLICLGLGSMGASSNARHQFACAILLQQEFSVGGVIYDPMMDNRDCETARSFGFGIGENCFDFGNLDEGVVVLFMPYCHFRLYQSVVEKLQVRGLMHRTVILGIRLRRTEGEMHVIAPSLQNWFLDLIKSPLLVQDWCGTAKDSTRELAFTDFAVSYFKQEQK